MYVVYFCCFICWFIGCENWGKKCVFLVGIYCGLSESEEFGVNVGYFNRRLLVNFMVGFLVFVRSGLKC